MAGLGAAGEGFNSTAELIGEEGEALEAVDVPSAIPEQPDEEETFQVKVNGGPATRHDAGYSGAFNWQTN